MAIDAGYASHEAFTRAFHGGFGISPERLICLGSLETQNLTEPIRMANSEHPELAPPRYECLPELKMLGLASRYDMSTNQKIPALWQQFNAWDGDFPEEVGHAAYGICFNFDGEGGFDYMAGCQVVEFDGADDRLTRLVIPARNYIVFRHTGHITDIGRTIGAVWSRGLEEAKACVLPSSENINFERYRSDFDLATGTGNVDYFIPLAQKD